MSVPTVPSEHSRDRSLTSRPGTMVLGRYRLIDPIGYSRGTSLWQAHDEVDGLAVTIRMAPMDSAIAADLRSAAQRASAVADDHAARVMDIGTDRALDSLVIVSEFSKGLTLGDILLLEGGRPLLLQDAVTIAHEVATLLVAVHADGVFHGSISPDSVVLTLDGEVRLTGLEVDDVLNHDRPADDRELADIHAVGAILFAGLTGAWPDALDQLEASVFDRATSGRGSRPSQVATGVPPDLDELVVRALRATSPESERFQSVAELEAALSPWVRLTDEATRGRSSMHMQARPRSRRLRGTGIALAVLAAISLVGLALALGVGGEPIVKPVTVPAASHSSAPANK